MMSKGPSERIENGDTGEGGAGGGPQIVPLALRVSAVPPPASDRPTGRASGVNVHEVIRGGGPAAEVKTPAQPHNPSIPYAFEAYTLTLRDNIRGTARLLEAENKYVLTADHLYGPPPPWWNFLARWRTSRPIKEATIYGPPGKLIEFSNAFTTYSLEADGTVRMSLAPVKFEVNSARAMLSLKLAGGDMVFDIAKFMITQGGEYKLGDRYTLSAELVLPKGADAEHSRASIRNAHAIVTKYAERLREI